MTNFSENEIDRMRDIFSKIDKDKNGEISVKELRRALKKTGIDFTCKGIHTIMKQVDENGDGRINCEEFTKCMANLPKQKENHAYSQAIKAFIKFDKNHDGFIDIDELKEALEDLNLETDPKKMEKIFETLDTDDNGQVDYIEFGTLVEVIYT